MPLTATMLDGMQKDLDDLRCLLESLDLHDDHGRRVRLWHSVMEHVRRVDRIIRLEDASDQRWE